MKAPLLKTSLSLIAGSLLLSACTAPVPRDAPSSTQTIPYSGGKLMVQPGSCTIQLQGAINSSTVAALHKPLEEFKKSNCSTKKMLFDSREGQASAAITIGSMLKNRGFDTHIPAGASCLTPCLLTFASGVQRSINTSPAPTTLGFSQLQQDDDYGSQRCESEFTGNQLLTLKRYLRAMLPANTADLMLLKIRATHCRDIINLTPEEALATGIATRTAN